MNEHKRGPDKEMGQSIGIAGAGPADATTRATGEAVSHAPAGQAHSQGSSRLGVTGRLNGLPCGKRGAFAGAAKSGRSFAPMRPMEHANTEATEATEGKTRN